MKESTSNQIPAVGGVISLQALDQEIQANMTSFVTKFEN